MSAVYVVAEGFTPAASMRLYTPSAASGCKLLLHAEMTVL